MNPTDPPIITATLVPPPHTVEEIISADLVTTPATPTESTQPTNHLVEASQTSLQSSARRTTSIWTIIQSILGVPHRIFQFAALLFLLAVCSTIPILQWASLGYMLDAGSRIATSGRWRSGLPGLKLAGRIGVILFGSAITFLPVWLVRDFAITGQLIDPLSNQAFNLETISWVMFGFWICHVIWAAVRGGKWWHFLWPQPVRFLREGWRPSLWNKALDRLASQFSRMQIPRLLWLGFRAFIGGLCWLALPASLMAIGLRGEERTPAQALVGFVGAVLMMMAVMYVPFLQMNLARENRFRAIFEVSKVFRQYRAAPWAFMFANFFTLGLAIPLYLLRIEATPEEYVWLLCLFFVLFTLPAKWLTGWAIYRAERRVQKRIWLSRYPAFFIQWGFVPIYIGFVYLSLLVVWDGVASVFLQHAFLIPLPFQGT